MARLLIFLALVAFAKTSPATQHIYYHGICDKDNCKCETAAHPAWVNVSCNANGTDMYVGTADLPPTTLELVINNAHYVVFGAGAFSKMEDIRLISLTKNKVVKFLPDAAQNLNVLNLSIEIRQCQHLRFDKKAFQNLIGPLSVMVDDCNMVVVYGAAFTWLLNFHLSNAGELQLASGAFSLDPMAPNVGTHGPGMAIKLINATIRELPRGSFASSAASLYFEGLNINIIRSGAFAANTYNVIDIVRCNIRIIETDAFSGNSLIHYITLKYCDIQNITNRAIISAVENLTINKSRFHHVQSGGLNTTAISVMIMSSQFQTFETKAFIFTSWNLLQMENNTFDNLPPDAIIAPAAPQHTLIFKYNEMAMVHRKSLSFIGKAAANGVLKYENNYYGISCRCNKSNWLRDMLDVYNDEAFTNESYCTVDEFLSRCFQMLDGNVVYNTFLEHVCTKSPTIECAPTVVDEDEIVEYRNPRFPHQVPTDNEGLSDRNKKVIGIVLVSCFGCIIIALLFSVFRFWKKGRLTGRCTLKTILMSSNTTCGSLCRRLCPCGSNAGITNARSISQLSVNEYSERHHLNASKVQDFVQESSFREELIVPTEDKCCQTLPEELTKELLDKLKERLDNPENYVEAREMIEHLYELTKITTATSRFHRGNNSDVEENIYELPYQDQAHIGRNKKKMVSVGTRTPSLDKLLPLSPYYRQTALSHEYFEPKDLAVHLYAEISNNDMDRKTKLGSIPDVIAEQAIPRGPYLQSKLQSSTSSCTPVKSSIETKDGPRATSTMKSTSSNSSGKMMNRPLPEKPSIDPRQGPSYRHA